jgi:hypothetical protein
VLERPDTIFDRFPKIFRALYRHYRGIFSKCKEDFSNNFRNPAENPSFFDYKLEITLIA